MANDLLSVPDAYLDGHSGEEWTTPLLNHIFRVRETFRERNESSPVMDPPTELPYKIFLDSYGAQIQQMDEEKKKRVLVRSGTPIPTSSAVRDIAAGDARVTEGLEGAAPRLALNVAALPASCDALFSGQMAEEIDSVYRDFRALLAESSNPALMACVKQSEWKATLSNFVKQTTPLLSADKNGFQCMEAAILVCPSFLFCFIMIIDF